MHAPDTATTLTQPAAAAAASGPLTHGAVFAILDLENLLHAVRDEGPTTVAATFEQICTQIRELDPDARIVGCGDHNLIRQLIGVATNHHVRLHPGQVGPDRADSELLGRLMQSRPASATTVLIGSGDHAFAHAAETLRGQGLHVLSLAWTGTISWKLYTAVDEHLTPGSARRRRGLLRRRR